ncbi:MAG TPA: AAA family ATPase [Hydrogenophaga sp.]|uniref:Lon protease family protein n=1 Tax=Hydrogenophaga sp. TaxID=1904254 RepID=UPI002BB0E49A|nr:AAA family ATPase [Hydrogenophaga sp.]HMN92979.1 AAA family ATPase [Hydrogenophaga sp.]HMP09135.1 AAA family ATPase [Hydrogenophaga sp.]
MALDPTKPEQLRLIIDPSTLPFSDTSELLGQPVPWIGQQRAEQAARFGLTMDQPDYHLFVLGEVGSGRSSLLTQLAREEATTRPVPPDLCYLYNFDVPERPRALRMPPGQGRELRQLMQQLCRTLQREVPLRLDGDDFKGESERIEASYKSEESRAFTELEAFAEQRRFRLFREGGHLVFTLIGDNGKAMTADEARALPREQRVEMDVAEQALRAEIAGFLEKTRPMARVMHEALAALRRQVVKPLLDHEMQAIRSGLRKQIKDTVKLNQYLDQVQHDVLEHVELFMAQECNEAERQEAMIDLLSRYQVNVAVDNAGREGAPVIIEDNPVVHALFGSIDYQAEEDVLLTDFSRVRAGSLLRAHGGFLLLHLRDLLADPLAWEKLRRFLRNGRVEIEEPAAAQMPIPAVSLRPQGVDVDVKLILIGTPELYYALQDGDPEFARHFRVKVDFTDSFSADAQTRLATAVFVAHTCRRLGLPHFSAGAVAALLEEAHREVDDQTRQSALFARTEALVMESASVCRERRARLVETTDVAEALEGRRLRHDLPAQRMRESIRQGDRLIALGGSCIGQVNGLTQIDMGDWRFGLPVRVSARTHAGHDGVVAIEREVAMSGPIHDKGVLILQGLLGALFAHVAPLALNASIVFEQEYQGIEGDSASCAELLALLSSLAGVPLRQNIAVTGALNQHGEIMPVGGINEKIEGWFAVCEDGGLDGTQGVLIPRRNTRHLMLSQRLVSAVRQGRFHVYTASELGEALGLLSGLPAGWSLGHDTARGYEPDSVLGRVQQTLKAYRRACRQAGRR